MLDPITHRFLASAGTRGPLVLMYHSVTPGRARPQWRWAVSLPRFREHLALLHSKGWATCTVSQLVAATELPRKTVAITFDDGYADNLHAVEALQRHDMTATFFIVTDGIGDVARWDATEAAPRPMLGAADLRNMRGLGMEIGAHTRRHAQLTNLENAAVKDEVMGSKAALEELLAERVQSFAYPYGLYDDRAVAAVEGAGYTAACSTRSGVFTGESPYLIPRLSVFNDDGPARLARKLGLAANEAGWAAITRYYGNRLGSRLRPGQGTGRADTAARNQR